MAASKRKLLFGTPTWKKRVTYVIKNVKSMRSKGEHIGASGLEKRYGCARRVCGYILELFDSGNGNPTVGDVMELYERDNKARRGKEPAKEPRPWLCQYSPEWWQATEQAIELAKDDPDINPRRLRDHSKAPQPVCERIIKLIKQGDEVNVEQIFYWAEDRAEENQRNREAGAARRKRRDSPSINPYGMQRIAGWNIPSAGAWNPQHPTCRKQ